MGDGIFFRRTARSCPVAMHILRGPSVRASGTATGAHSTFMFSAPRYWFLHTTSDGVWNTRVVRLAAYVLKGHLASIEFRALVTRFNQKHAVKGAVHLRSHALTTQNTFVGRT